MAEPLFFNEFIDKTACARVDDYIGTLRAASAQFSSATPALSSPPRSQERDQLASEFDRMKRYILDYYGNGKISPKSSFLGLDGHPIDCIPFEAQPGVRDARTLNHSIQMNAPAAADFAVEPSGAKLNASGTRSKNSVVPQGAPLLPQLARGLVDPLGNELVCPAGHVPIRRVTLKQLTRFRNLEGYFQKSPGGGAAPWQNHGDGSPSGNPLLQGGSGEWHRHAHAAQLVSNLGVRSSLNVWAPNPDPGAFSLSQIWLTAGSNASLQTIESGWQIYPQIYGDRLPHLFIYFTNHNYASGSGWYNLDKPPGESLGFVQFATPVARSWVIGGALSNSSLGLSSVDGPQVSITIQWQRDTTTGNWFLYLSRDGITLDPIGYYPGQLFANGPLATASDRVDFGGEVCGALPTSPNNPSPISTATGEMGSGQPSASGALHAAYHDRVFYLPTSGGALQAASLTPQVDPYDAPYYSVSIGSADNGKRTYFYFGGHSAP